MFVGEGGWGVLGCSVEGVLEGLPSHISLLSPTGVDGGTGTLVSSLWVRARRFVLFPLFSLQWTNSK